MDTEKSISVEILNPYRTLPGYNCFGCSPDNPFGLKLHFHKEGDEVTCEWNPEQQFQGWMNVLHGGIQATLMDEIASWFVFVQMNTAGVTSKMEVKLMKPAKMDRGPFRMRARLHEMRRNIAVIHVDLFDGHGVKVAESLMHYFTWPEEIARQKLYYPGIEKFYAGGSTPPDGQRNG